MTPSNPTKTPAVPTYARIGVLFGGAVAALGSLAGMWIALFAAPETLWATVGFAIVAATAAGFAIATGLGRFAVGYGMATLCVGGTIAVAAGFAMLDMRPNLGDNPQVARLVMPWVGVQVLSAGLIVFAGAVAVLDRRKSAWRTIAKGLAFLIPAAAIAAGTAFAMSRIPDDGSARVLNLALLLVGGTIIGVLVSLGGHFLIRAFEQTAEDPATTPS